MTKKLAPREVPSRENYYMALAFWAASKSKDPHSQIGAVIVSTNNKPLGWGYNGPPPQILDTAFSWDRPEKYTFIEHAEENAIDHSLGSLADATIYVTAKPCVRCTRKIIKKGLKKIIYYPWHKLIQVSDPDSSLVDEDADKKIEELAKFGIISVVEFDGNLNWMRDRIKWMESIGVFE